MNKTLSVVERDDELTLNSRKNSNAPRSGDVVLKHALSTVRRILRQSGFTLRNLRPNEQGYISKGDQRALHPDGLCIRLSHSITNHDGWLSELKLCYYQHLVPHPRPNPNGPMWECDRLRYAPYLFRQRAKLLNRRIQKALQDELADVSNDRSDARRKSARARIEENIKSCWHYNAELGHAAIQPGNDRDMNGDKIDHGGLVWFRDNKGRWSRARAFFNLNRQWYLQLSETEVDSAQSFQLSVTDPLEPRQKNNAKLRSQRHQELYGEAKSDGNFFRAAALQKLLFKSKLYRLYSTKHGGGYWRPHGAGYTSNVNEAGLFAEQEASDLVRGSHGELTMEPCGENEQLKMEAS